MIDDDDDLLLSDCIINQYMSQTDRRDVKIASKSK